MIEFPGIEINPSVEKEFSVEKLILNKNKKLVDQVTTLKVIYIIFINS